MADGTEKQVRALEDRMKMLKLYIRNHPPLWSRKAWVRVRRQEKRLQAKLNKAYERQGIDRRGEMLTDDERCRESKSQAGALVVLLTVGATVTVLTLLTMKVMT